MKTSGRHPTVLPLHVPSAARSRSRPSLLGARRRPPLARPGAHKEAGVRETDPHQDHPYWPIAEHDRSPRGSRSTDRATTAAPWRTCPAATGVDLDRFRRHLRRLQRRTGRHPRPPRPRVDRARPRRGAAPGGSRSTTASPCTSRGRTPRPSRPEGPHGDLLPRRLHPQLAVPTPVGRARQHRDRPADRRRGHPDRVAPARRDLPTPPQSPSSSAQGPSQPTPSPLVSKRCGSVPTRGSGGRRCRCSRGPAVMVDAHVGIGGIASPPDVGAGPSIPPRGRRRRPTSPARRPARHLATRRTRRCGATFGG